MQHHLAWFVVLVCGVLSVSNAQTSTAVQNMVANTNFLQSKTNCDPNSNSYIAAIYNSFVTPTDVIFELDCDNSISQTNPITVAALTQSLQQSVYPFSGGVGNRVCTLGLIIRNTLYNNNEWTKTKTYQSTCGTVVSNGATTNCGYASIDCLIQEGQCIGNAMCWLFLIYPPMVVIGALLIATVYLLGKNRRANKQVLAPISTQTTVPNPRGSSVSPLLTTSSPTAVSSGYYG